MAIQYIVKSGDTLTSIAKQHGLNSWRDIYDFPANVDFRRKRPNPDLIYPGDALLIPVAGLSPTSGEFRLCGRDEMPNLSPFGPLIG